VLCRVVVRRSKWALGLALFGSLQAGAAAAQTRAFDGHWSITLLCPASADGAASFRFDFFGDIADGALHGEYGQAGQPGSMALDGQLEPNGDARLTARGLTGHSVYNINQTAQGMPYSHPVTAHFDGRHGAGRWLAARVCNFTFERL